MPYSRLMSPANNNLKMWFYSHGWQEFLLGDSSYITEVDSRTQSLRPRTKKKSKTKERTDFLRTDPLEAKDRNARGQGPRTQRV